MAPSKLLALVVVLIWCCFATVSACKWAHLAASGMDNPHLKETYTEDDLGKFENIQAFEDIYSGVEHEHVPYRRHEQLLKPDSDL